MKTKWNMYQLAMVCSDLYKELKNFCYHPCLMILIRKYKHNIGVYRYQPIRKKGYRSYTDESDYYPLLK